MKKTMMIHVLTRSLRVSGGFLFIFLLVFGLAGLEAWAGTAGGSATAFNDVETFVRGVVTGPVGRSIGLGALVLSAGGLVMGAPSRPLIGLAGMGGVIGVGPTVVDALVTGLI